MSEKVFLAAQESVKHVYASEQPSALVNKVEITQAADGGHYLFFHGQNVVESKAMHNAISEHLPQTKLLDSSKIQDKPILIAYSAVPPEQLLQQWSKATGETFREEKIKVPKKKVDLIKMRGHIGNIGQIFMVASGFFDSGKAGNIDKINEDANAILATGVGNRVGTGGDIITKKDIKSAQYDAVANNFYQTADGRAKVISAGLSFFGNGMNSHYGVQKKEDATRLEYGKRMINQSLYSHDVALPSSKENLTRKEQKFSWMEQNSLKFSNGVKLVGKYYLSTAKNKQLSAAGNLSMVSKVITLLGKGEDPYQLENDQSVITRLRRSSNAIAGTMEWLANITMWTGALFAKADKNVTLEPKVLDNKLNAPFQYFKALIKPLFDMDKTKFRGKEGIQWFQLLGATAIFGSLTAKSLAPFAVKTIDTDELTTHASEALAVGARNKNYQGDLTRITTQLVQTWELDECKDRGFAYIYTDIANRLAQNHQIAVHEQDNIEQAVHAANQPKKTPEVSIEAKKETGASRDDGQKESSVQKRILENKLLNQSLAEKELQRQSTLEVATQAAMG